MEKEEALKFFKCQKVILGVLIANTKNPVTYSLMLNNN